MDTFLHCKTWHCNIWLAAWWREAQSRNSRSVGRSGFALAELCWRPCTAHMHNLLWKLLSSHKYFEKKKDLWILMDLQEIFTNLMLWDLGCSQNTGWIKGFYSLNQRNRLNKNVRAFCSHCVKPRWMGDVSNLNWCGVDYYYKIRTFFSNYFIRRCITRKNSEGMKNRKNRRVGKIAYSFLLPQRLLRETKVNFLKLAQCLIRYSFQELMWVQMIWGIMKDWERMIIKLRNLLLWDAMKGKTQINSKRW